MIQEYEHFGLTPKFTIKLSDLLIPFDVHPRSLAADLVARQHLKEQRERARVQPSCLLEGMPVWRLLELDLFLDSRRPAQ